MKSLIIKTLILAYRWKTLPVFMYIWWTLFSIWSMKREEITPLSIVAKLLPCTLLCATFALLRRRKMASRKKRIAPIKEIIANMLGNDEPITVVEEQPLRRGVINGKTKLLNGEVISNEDAINMMDDLCYTVSIGVDAVSRVINTIGMSEAVCTMVPVFEKRISERCQSMSRTRYLMKVRDPTHVATCQDVQDTIFSLSESFIHVACSGMESLNGIPKMYFLLSVNGVINAMRSGDPVSSRITGPNDTGIGVSCNNLMLLDERQKITEMVNLSTLHMKQISKLTSPQVQRYNRYCMMLLKESDETMSSLSPVKRTKRIGPSDPSEILKSCSITLSSNV